MAETKDFYWHSELVEWIRRTGKMAVRMQIVYVGGMTKYRLFYI